MASSTKKKKTVFTIHNVEVIVVDDDDNHIIHLRDLSIEEVAQLANIVFRNGYDILIRREVDDE